MLLSKGCLFGKLLLSTRLSFGVRDGAFQATSLFLLSSIFSGLLYCVPLPLQIVLTLQSVIKSFFIISSEKLSAYPSKNKQTRSAIHCPIFYLVMQMSCIFNFKFCLLLRRLKYIILRALEIGKTQLMMHLCFGDYKKGLHEIFVCHRVHQLRADADVLKIRISS